MRHAMVAGAVGAALAGNCIQALAALPPVHDSGAVAYMSGGIGLDESGAIQRASGQWPLTLEFSARDGSHADFLADVKVRVLDANGHAVLDATSEGPFLLAKLPPGPYVVDGTFAGKTIKERVLIRPHQPAKAVFVWQASASDSQS